MNIIQSETISADASGKWKWNFNFQTPGTYKIEIIPTAADGTQAPAYYKNIVITQEEIDALLAYKRKKYYKILNYDTPDYSNGQLTSIVFEDLPKDVMYPGEQNIRKATIKFNQSYWYADGDESIIHVLLVETETPTNILSNKHYVTENEHGNYTDPADEGYDPDEVSIIKNVEFNPKIIDQYESVTLKIMRQSSLGTTEDIYINDIPLLDYNGTLNDGAELTLVDVSLGTHPDSSNNYRIMNYNDIIYVGQELENIIITSDKNDSLNFKSMKVIFKIEYVEYEDDGVTVKNTDIVTLDSNIIDVGIDVTDVGYVFEPIVRLPYLYSFSDGEINIVYEATLEDDSVIEVASLKYAYN